MPELKQIVKDNEANFSFYRNGNCFYKVTVDGQNYEFPVPVDDVGQASLLAKFKAITLMRYIRTSLQEGTFVKCK